MCNIILSIFLIIAILMIMVILRGFYLQKKVFDEVLLKIAKDHEVFINVQKGVLKEFKTRYDDISKILKDINTIRTGLKNLLEDLRVKTKLLTDKIEK
jgi:methyl-accepting chemotaxis protein